MDHNAAVYYLDAALFTRKRKPLLISILVNLSIFLTIFKKDSIAQADSKVACY